MSDAYPLEVRVLQELCKDIDSPRSLAVFLLTQSDDWDELDSLQDPVYRGRILGDTPRRYGYDLQVTSLLKKHPEIGGFNAEQRQARALQKWLEAEEKCRTTNAFIRRYLSGREFLPEGIEDMLTKARSFIAAVLGDVRHYLPDVIRLGKFGPGANLSVRGSRVAHPNKYFPYEGSISPALYRFLGCFRWETTTQPKVVGANELVFVPKNSRIDRPITIEPHWNSYIQLGIGGVIRRRLKAAGYDLDNQFEHNREFARLAWERRLCTIDLSSASDTMSLELVRLLVPPEWVVLLELARVRFSEYNDPVRGRTRVLLQKFSGMGNGYTFELETLLFMALCYGAGEQVPVVFGDDIIVHESHSSNLLKLLEIFGFTVNREKTFLAGMFFESCGADFIEGENVRPIYFKRPLFQKGHERHDLRDNILAANQLRLRSVDGAFCDSVFREAWLLLAEPYLNTVSPMNRVLLGLFQPHTAAGMSPKYFALKQATAAVSAIGYYFWCLDKGSPENPIGYRFRDNVLERVALTRNSSLKERRRLRAFTWCSGDSFIGPWV